MAERILRPVLAGIVAFTLPTATIAQASSIDERYSASSFSTSALGDADLAGVYGSGLQRYREQTFKLMVDGYQLGDFQQTAQTSQIAMDNWWAQAGAALIDNNLIARQLGR